MTAAGWVLLVLPWPFLGLAWASVLLPLRAWQEREEARYFLAENLRLVDAVRPGFLRTLRRSGVTPEDLERLRAFRKDAVRDGLGDPLRRPRV